MAATVHTTIVKMNIRSVKLFDEYIGRLFTSLLPTPTHHHVQTPPYSLLLIRPGGIGDAVLLAPTIRLIKTIYPDCKIAVLAERRNAGVFDLIPGVNQLYCYDTPSEFIQALRNNYDVVIDTEQWHRLSAVVARLIPAPIKIGFATNERQRMFTHTEPYCHDEYEVESFLRLARTFCGETTPTIDLAAPFLTIPENAKDRINTLLEPLQGQPYLVIFPGASIAERRWGAENYHTVALQLPATTGVKIVVVGGTVDQADAAVIAGAQGISLAGKTSLVETAAVIAEAKLLISADSGLLHLAVGLDVPTVSLFGPGIAAKWAPVGSKHRVVNHHLPCSPCTKFGTTPPCPHNVRCMREITSAEIVEAAALFLISKH